MILNSARSCAFSQSDFLAGHGVKWPFNFDHRMRMPTSSNILTHLQRLVLTPRDFKYCLGEMRVRRRVL